MSPIRVFLVDDHTVLRQAVAAMLAGENDMEVVGQSGDGRRALDELGRLRPDVVILDLKMPEIDGLSLLPQILEASPKSRVVMFTMYENPIYVHTAMQAGATGYVLKSVERDELLRAIRAVHRGSGYLQAEVTRPLLRRLALKAERSALSVREIQVLELLAAGSSNKEIAQRLAISDETVKSHLKRLYDKLGVSDRAEAVAIALRQNLID
jgi:DNA-binding NarL/FixJ family response regulator